MSSSIWQIFERGSAIDDFLLRRQTLCFLRLNNWTFALLKRGLRNALNVFSFYFDDHSARMATWPSTAVNRWFIENVKKLQVTNHSWKLTSIRLSPGRNPFLSALGGEDSIFGSREAHFEPQHGHICLPDDAKHKNNKKQHEAYKESFCFTIWILEGSENCAKTGEKRNV